MECLYTDELPPGSEDARRFWEWWTGDPNAAEMILDGNPDAAIEGTLARNYGYLPEMARVISQVAFDNEMLSRGYSNNGGMNNG